MHGWIYFFIYECVDVRMGVWKDGWMVRWVDKRVVSRMDWFIYNLMVECTVEYIEERMVGCGVRWLTG
jgi:hypothetical protein